MYKSIFLIQLLFSYSLAMSRSIIALGNLYLPTVLQTVTLQDLDYSLGLSAAIQNGVSGGSSNGGETVKISFKMDNLQPSGSFKDRGISHMIKTLVEQSTVSKLVCSSGGNAGHAVATTGKKLGLPVDVFVPITTKPMMIAKLRGKGANVFIGGENWNAADAQARIALAQDADAKYIPPFDDPLIWDGNASIVEEMKESLGDHPPDAIVLSVGGGGLLCGVQRGLEKVGWTGVKIMAVETEGKLCCDSYVSESEMLLLLLMIVGTASFAAAKEAGKVVSIGGITSIASSLGALAVTPATLDSCITTESVVVSDKDAVQACLWFADQHRALVEPACGAAIAIVHNDKYRKLWSNMNHVVVIVCGGSAVNLELLRQWEKDLC